jgi:hypothetical protein
MVAPFGRSAGASINKPEGLRMIKDGDSVATGLLDAEIHGV